MWKKIFRYRKLQTFLLFVIVLLSSLSLCGSVSILISLKEPYQRLADECKAATAMVWTLDSSKEATEKIKSEFEALDNVDHVYECKGHSIAEEMTAGDKVIESFSVLAEYNDDIFRDVRYVEGETVQEKLLDTGECMIPACICIEYGLKIGDEICIKLPNENVTYKIRAIYAEPYGASIAYDNFILVKELPESVEPHYYIRLYGKEGITGSDIEEAYREKYVKMDCMINSLETEISNNLLAGTIVGAILLAIGVILLVVSCLIINFMVRHTLKNDAKSIAVYKVIGYSGSDIIKMYIAFYFVVVSAGIICGILGSGFFQKMVLVSMYQNIGVKASGNVLLPGICCYVVMMGFVLSIIYFIMKKAGKLKPVNVLNNMESENTKKKKKYKGYYKMQFSSFGIASRLILRDKKGTIGIVITAIVTIFAMNFAIISLDVANSLKENNDYWLGIERSDVMVTTADGIDAKDIEKLLKDRPEIDHMNLCNLEDGRFTLDWKKGMDFTLVFPFIYDDFDEAGYKVIKGRNPRNANEIAISYKVLKETGKQIGDYLNVNMNDQKYSLLITGIYQTYYSMGKSARITTKTYTENDIPFRYDNVSIYLKDGTDQEAFMNEIKKIVGSKGSVTKRTEMFSAIMTIIMTPQQKAIPPMSVLILLIGATNIFCIVMLKNANSEKNNGIYKRMGYSSGHLIRSNIWYVSMIALCSLIIAVPSTFILYPYILKLSLSMFGLLEYRITYNVGHLILTNIGILLAFICSTILSSKSLKKVSVMEFVQE